MVITVVIIALASSGIISKLFHLDSAGLFLFQAFVVAFFFSSLKTIPSILLERHIQFDKLIIPQIIETCAFNITLLVLAIMGWGVLSYAWAVLARGLFGLVALYILAPWKMQIGFSKPVAKRLLSFGIPFQSNSILALLKDDLLALYLGQIFAASQGYLGYITFAQKWAFTPLRLVMDNIIRITFPSFSRIREHEEILGKAIEKSLFAAVILIFPALMGMSILGPYFLRFIPKYHQWEPALLSLVFFAINAALSAISTPLTNALNAIGRVKTTLYLMVFWTIATWVLTPLCIMWFGFNGVAIASAIISTSVVGVVYVTKKYIRFSILPAILTPSIASVVMGILLLIVSPLVIRNIYILLGMVGAGGLVYFGMMYILAKEFIIEDVKMIIGSLKK
jgi:O-antigen/teichoic acid export membrane protein